MPKVRSDTSPIHITFSAMNLRKTKKIVYNTLVICLLLGTLFYVSGRFIHTGSVEWTDNAEVVRHIVPVQTRIQGYIREIRFDDYSQVRRGDTLVIIEDAEFRYRLAEAEASLANARAGSSVTAAGINALGSSVAQAASGIEEARVRMDNARRDYERYADLLKAEAVTQQQYDQMRTAYEAAKARYEQTAHQRTATEHARGEQTERLRQNEANIRLSEAAVRLARLNLGYTVIVAACNGTVGRKRVSEGQLVQPGQALTEIVDANSAWVIANYRESQLRHIAKGSPAVLQVDAFPDEELRGTVERLSSATGAAVSLIPHDNATGNFVKVEQRVPVRISLAGNPDSLLSRLQSGLAVKCSIDYSEKGRRGR